MNARKLFSNILVALPLLAGATFLTARWIDSQSRVTQSVGIDLRPGMSVPSIPLRAADGVTAPLPSLLTHPVNLVIIVDPDCPHCHTKLEAIEAIGAESPEPLSIGIRVISVGDEVGTSALRERYVTTAIYQDLDRVLVEEYGLTAVPVLAVVDRRGAVQSVDVGWTGEGRLRELMGRRVSGT